VKVYTKKGDLGKTSILGQNNLDKDDLRITAYGTVDELNSQIGLLTCYSPNDVITNQLRSIQNALFTLGSELASTPDVFHKLKLQSLSNEDVTLLENWIDDQTNELPNLQSFILPGGSLANATAHVARTVCRRAERACVILNKELPIRPLVIIYLNRLSDYLFTMARTMTLLTNTEEIEWKPNKD